MTVLNGVIMGKEQLILLPVEQMAFDLEADRSVTIQMLTGRHAIVASGYIGIQAQGYKPGGSLGFILNDSDDEVIHETEIHCLIGPLWNDLVQVSASVSPAGIFSMDSDEVDHSRWVVTECTWEVATVSSDEQIRLKVKLQTQGYQNGWVNLAYQVVATGTLARMPTVEEISADL